MCRCYTVSAQIEDFVWHPSSAYQYKPGFITINVLTAGIGLKITDVPYSKSFIGFTTVNGYQINRNFIAAVGTGLSFYNGGMLIPLFLDFRYMYNLKQFTPFIVADGGFLLNFSNFIEGTKLFINPSIGIMYYLPKKIALTFGGGLLIQYGPIRDSFLNLNVGAYYKF